MAVIIDTPMPINCVDCDRRYIRGIIDCKLIFSGCANCGRHPKCPLKNTDDLKAEFDGGRTSAQWIGEEYDGYEDGNPVYTIWSCSHCGAELMCEDIDFEFCPRCGSRMGGR